MRLGRVLSGTEIDALLASGLPEAEVYAQVSARFILLENGQPCGGGWGMARMCLIWPAVPQRARRWPGARAGGATAAVVDPGNGGAPDGGAPGAGGLRWILAEVLRRADGTKVPPVVINLSLGSLAAPAIPRPFWRLDGP